MSVLCKVWSPDNQVVSSISSEVTGGDGGAEVFSDVRTGDLAVDGRADEAGPWLARDVEEASAGNGRAQSSITTF